MVSMKRKHHAGSLSLSYAYHAIDRARESQMPVYHHLPPTAALWDIHPERGASRYLVNSARGPVCVVLSDWPDCDGVVITTYDPRRREHWNDWGRVADLKRARVVCAHRAAR